MLYWGFWKFSSRPEVENMTLLNLRVNSIEPQSFIQIGPRVSEILQPTPKMNAVLPLVGLEYYLVFYYLALNI